LFPTNRPWVFPMLPGEVGFFFEEGRKNGNSQTEPINTKVALIPRFRLLFVCGGPVAGPTILYPDLAFFLPTVVGFRETRVRKTSGCPPLTREGKPTLRLTAFGPTSRPQNSSSETRVWNFAFHLETCWSWAPPQKQTGASPTTCVSPKSPGTRGPPRDGPPGSGRARVFPPGRMKRCKFFGGRWYSPRGCEPRFRKPGGPEPFFRGPSPGCPAPAPSASVRLARIMPGGRKRS